MQLSGVAVVVADTLYFTDIRLEGIIANSLVAPFQQEMFWRDYSRIYEVEVYAPDVQIQCMYIACLCSGGSRHFVWSGGGTRRRL